MGVEFVFADNASGGWWCCWKGAVPVLEVGARVAALSVISASVVAVAPLTVSASAVAVATTPAAHDAAATCRVEGPHTHTYVIGGWSRMYSSYRSSNHGCWRSWDEKPRGVWNRLHTQPVHSHYQSSSSSSSSCVRSHHHQPQSSTTTHHHNH